MSNTGRELRDAREQAGLSAEMVAQRTKFKLYRIVALDNGDFANLPEGTYLDAIVRAYALEVGIDPEQMVERVRAERGKRPGDAPTAGHEPVDFERRDAPQIAETGEPSRATVALSALLLLALLGWGSYLYEASGAAKRDIPGKMYAALTGRAQAQVSPLSANPRPVPPEAIVLPPQIVPGNGVVAATNEPERKRATAASHEDVTGSWRLATQVESSKYARYEDLLLGYELELEQDGDRVSGVGRKIVENGTGIYSRGQTPIAISGIADGDRLMLTFIEEGAQRSSRGAFVLRREQDGTLRGRLTTNAAGSAGSAEARRVR